MESLDLDITNFDCDDIGENTVILTVTDSSGNFSTVTSTVTVEDSMAPVAIAQNISVELNDSNMAAITASAINNGSTDNCGIQSISVDIMNFDVDDVGANTVVLTVIDTSGNSTTTTAIVTVTGGGTGPVDTYVTVFLTPMTMSFYTKPKPRGFG